MISSHAPSRWSLQKQRRFGKHSFACNLLTTQIPSALDENWVKVHLGENYCFVSSNFRTISILIDHFLIIHQPTNGFDWPLSLTLHQWGCRPRRNQSLPSQRQERSNLRWAPNLPIVTNGGHGASYWEICITKVYIYHTHIYTCIYIIYVSVCVCAVSKSILNQTRCTVYHVKTPQTLDTSQAFSLSVSFNAPRNLQSHPYGQHSTHPAPTFFLEGMSFPGEVKLCIPLLT